MSKSLNCATFWPSPLTQYFQVRTQAREETFFDKWPILQHGFNFTSSIT